MINYALRAAMLGAFYTAITSVLAGIGLSDFWEGLGDGFLLLLIFWVPAFGIAGLLIGAVLFLLVGFIISNSSNLRSKPIASFSVIGGIIALLPLLVFCSVAVGIHPIAALFGSKGSYLVLVPGIFAASTAGMLLGRKY